MAQVKTISGVVLDESNGTPLIGVSVVVKGTTVGQFTDINGGFSISVSQGQTLEFTYLGMITKEIVVTGEMSKMTVYMKPDAILMDETVVVGYGVTRKRDISGAISSLKTDDIKAGVVTNMSEMIKGRAAGVQVKQNSLEPGGSVSIRIRGASSISANNEPLYVIDGFQTDNMDQINPDDIASIEILKDAATTAIYGARGSNGVILITTKKGAKGLFTVDYSYNASVKMMKNPWDLMDAGETIEAAMKRYNETPSIPNPPYTAEQALYRGKGEDWLDATTRDATTQSHQISIAGGGEQLNSFVSLNYITEPGILLNTNYERYGGRINLNYKLNDRVRFGANMNLVHFEKQYQDMGKNSSLNNIMYRIFMLPPLTYKDGTNVFGEKAQRPGVFDEMSGSQLFKIGNTVYGSLYGEVDILKSLTARVQYTYGYDHYKDQQYYDRSTNIGRAYNGQAFVSHEEDTRNQIEAVLTWHQNFGKIHDVKLMAGTSYIRQKVEGDEAQVFDFPSDVFKFKSIGSANQVGWVGSGESTIKNSSTFARAEYVLMDKYIFNASFRADGSSLFGPNNRWGCFPSGSAAWQLGEESFMAFSKPLFSDIKLRASYGLTGNNGIRFGQHQYQRMIRDVYLGGEQMLKGMYPGNPYNPHLKWETTSQLNFGLDFSLLNKRIEVNFDYYIKKTKDLLNPVPIGAYTGMPGFRDPNTGRVMDYTAMTANDGRIRNRGFELFIKSNNITTKDFNWSSTLNVSQNKNKVLDLTVTRYDIIRPHGSYDDKEYVILQEGQSLSSIYGYVFDGIIQNGETYSAQPNSVPGDPKFKDLDKNGIIDENDRKVIGDGNPDVILGLSNNFTYKDFDFSFFLEAAIGNDMLNLTRIYLEDNNRLKETLNRWTPGGRVVVDESGNTAIIPGTPSNTIPRAGYMRDSGVKYGSYVNSRFVENASYLKLRNIEIGYTLPVTKWKFLHSYVKGMRVYVGAQNLFTITSYSGFDPDVSTNDGNPVAQGLDFNSYPAYRTFNFGAKITF
ncbi:MAG: SusC/RagA family TonB-linked outer membrane protein [Dysgonomonas sp.]